MRNKAHGHGGRPIKTIDRISQRPLKAVFLFAHRGVAAQVPTTSLPATLPMFSAGLGSLVGLYGAKSENWHRSRGHLIKIQPCALVAGCSNGFSKTIIDCSLAKGTCR